MTDTLEVQKKILEQLRINELMLMLEQELQMEEYEHCAAIKGEIDDRVKAFKEG